MKKRIIALLLIAAALVSCLAACGGNEQTTDPTAPGADSALNDTSAKYQRMEAEAVTSKYAYKVEYIDLPIETGYLSEPCVSGNMFYFVADVASGKDSYTDEETGEVYEYDTYEEILFRMDLTTHECVPVDGALDAAQETEDEDGWEYSSYIQGSAAGPDDSLWLNIQRNSYRFNIPEGVDEEENRYNYDYYESGDTVNTLIHVCADGTVDKTIRVGTQTDDGPASDVVIGGFYMSNFYVDSNGYIYVSDYETVLVWDGEGTRVMELDVSQYGGLVQYSADRVGVIEYGETRRFKTIDPVKKDFGESIDLPQFAYGILPGDDVYDFYYEYNNKIYGYIAETQTAEKVVDWLECDVDDQNMQSYAMLSDGRVFAMTQDYAGDGNWDTQLILMERVDAETLPQKQTLVLACFSLDYNLRSQIVKFNQKNQNYRIVVRDYAEYATEDDYEAGLTKLITEITSGVMPDLLDTSYLPARQYAAKGLLRDIWPIIDADENVSREDFVTEVLDALSVDGKLYQLPTSFTLSTVAGMEKTVGEYETWTVDDVMDAMTKLREDATIFDQTYTRDTIMLNCVGQNINTFVDWANGTCSFDSDEFKSLLEFAAQFPESFNYDDYEYTSAYSRMRNGEQLLTSRYFYGFDELYAQFKALDDQPCFVGYPTSASGTPVRSTFSCESSIAITAACADVDTAWAFLRSVLSDDYQDSLWAFPISKSAFDAKLAEAMEQEFYTDPDTGEQVEMSKGGIGYGDDDMIEIYAVTEEQRDIFMDLLHSTTTVESTDQNIMNIVSEVAGSYFAGDKTLEETVQIIQNRVNLYVMEQS